MIKRIYLFAAIFLTFASTILAQSPWELKKDQNGILIYTRPSKTSKYNELRAVFDLPGTYDQLRAVLNDVTNYKTWVYATSASSLVERKSETEIIYYSQISAPWPVSNRDFYSDTRIWIDSANHQMRLSSRNLDHFPPSKSVRIAHLQAEWTITAPTSTTLHVEYMLVWDPGGNIPAFIANGLCTSGPVQSFTQLKKKMSLITQQVVANRSAR